jgi:hypothetical protein
MIDLITDTEKFKYIEQINKANFNESKDALGNDLSKTFAIIFEFNFDLFYDNSFFEMLKDITCLLKEDEFYFYTIEPSPSYFYKHFKKFNSFSIPKSATVNEFNEVLMKNPGDSPADAIAINSSVVTMFSESSSWGCIGFRDDDIAQIGFKNETIERNFFSSGKLDKDYFIKLK